MELRGPNGAGKSTLLRLLAGFLSPSEGQLKIAGGELGLHYVGHGDGIKLALTVSENLRFWQGLYGGDIEAALSAFSLGTLADEQALYLSQGQRRRLALSRLALTPRPIWLLDEPANGLDDASLQKLRSLMSRHLDQGGGLIAATHVHLGLPNVQQLVLAVRT